MWFTVKTKYCQAPLLAWLGSTEAIAGSKGLAGDLWPFSCIFPTFSPVSCFKYYSVPSEIIESVFKLLKTSHLEIKQALCEIIMILAGIMPSHKDLRTGSWCVGGLKHSDLAIAQSSKRAGQSEWRGIGNLKETSAKKNKTKHWRQRLKQGFSQTPVWEQYGFFSNCKSCKISKKPGKTKWNIPSLVISFRCRLTKKWYTH